MAEEFRHILNAKYNYSYPLVTSDFVTEAVMQNATESDEVLRRKLRIEWLNFIINYKI